jgi:hypothetical protein
MKPVAPLTSTPRPEGISAVKSGLITADEYEKMKKQAMTDL